MTRRDKQLTQVRANPRNVRFRDLEGVLIDAGFEMRRSKRGTSHHVFFHPLLDFVVVLVTHGRNDVLPGYQVRQALVALDMLEKDE